MWESKIYGFKVHNNTDFFTLSYQGIHVMDTCSEDEEVITDTRNEVRMLQPPKAFDFLKLTKKNCLYFNQSEKTRRVLNI